MWKHVGEVLDGVRQRVMGPGPSDRERRIVAKMHSDGIRRELANRAAAAQAHEERQEQAYWELWRLIRSPRSGPIPPQILDPLNEDHVSLALSIVADFDEARERADAFAEYLYRPVSSLPYSPAVIRRCCEFLIQIADSPPPSFNGDSALLVRERDALGLALFSLDFFLDLPASEIPKQKLENAKYLKEQYLAGSAPPPKPAEGDMIYKTGRLKDYVDVVMGVSENDEWMVVTKSGSSMQIVRSGEAGKWNEVAAAAPSAAASWLDLTPPFGVPAQ